MKIGILTFHNADNYGAVLQAYALQQKLNSLGFENEFVEIDTGNSSDKNETGNTENAVTGAAAIFARKVKAENEKRNGLFKEFRDKYFNVSETYHQNNMNSIGKEYDALIAGSDQVWNFSLPDFDLRYLLPFEGKVKKYSYAASFGNEPDEKLMKQAMTYLNRFDGISVREKSGKELIEKYSDKKALVLPDPTLLLDRKDWDKLADAAPTEKGRYVLLFLLKNDDKLAEQAKDEADRSGVALKVVCAGYIPKYGFDSWSGNGVEKWISLIKNADSVFTNSFHGTVFSLIYGKKFRTAPLGGNLSERNGRLDELLSRVGLRETFDGKTVSINEETLADKLRSSYEEAEEFLRKISE